MSRFLARLAARSLGLTPLVRPRLRGLFEPAGLGAVAARPEEGMPAAAAEPRGAATAPAELVPGAHAESDLLRLEVAEEPGRSPAIAAPRGRATAEAKAGERPAPAVAPVPEALLARTQAVELPMSSSPSTPRPPGRTPPIPGQTPAAATAAPVAGERKAQAVAPTFPAPGAVILAPPAPLLDVQDSPALSLSAPGPEAGGTATSPDVRITIGRVEIRAQVEARKDLPVVRKAERRRQQPLSLEEYLRHGAKGGR
jgi:hypothetical protein